jgi:subtilisin family serine protease
VITALQDKAAETQDALLALVDTAKKAGQVGKVKAVWITNAIAISAKPAFMRRIEKRSDIRSLYLDYEIELIEPVGEPIVTPVDMERTRAIENGILVSRAPELWALGIDGTGALACDQDTGADGNHPAFADRWRGLEAGAIRRKPGSIRFPVRPSPPTRVTTAPTRWERSWAKTATTRSAWPPAQSGSARKTIDVPGGNISPTLWKPSSGRPIRTAIRARPTTCRTWSTTRGA